MIRSALAPKYAHFWYRNIPQNGSFLEGISLEKLTSVSESPLNACYDAVFVAFVWAVCGVCFTLRFMSIIMIWEAAFFYSRNRDFFT